MGCFVTVSPDAATAKAAARADLLAARRTLDPQRLARDAARVRAALLAVLPGLLGGVGRDATIGCYVPVGREPGGPDLPDAVGAALPAGARLLLPVLRDDLDLDWAAHGDRLVPTSRGLAEPAGPRLGVEAVRPTSLLVVPALAVDRAGVRLGRGGGSYDRVLARIGPAATVVALLHDGELWQRSLPAEGHDRRVDAVITPSLGLVRLRSAPAAGVRQPAAPPAVDTGGSIGHH